jgi:hypothetical protein
MSEGSVEDVVLHAENNAECVVWMDWAGERIVGVGNDYFTALTEVREKLEALGVKLLCNGDLNRHRGKFTVMRSPGSRYVMAFGDCLRFGAWSGEA